MEDLQRLMLLRLLVVLGPGLMLCWLRFGLNPPQPLPLWIIGVFLALIALAFVALRLRVRSATSVTAWELFGYLQFDVLALSVLLYFSGGAAIRSCPYCYCL